MSIRVLNGNRTRYRNLLEKELGKGKHILEEDREEVEVKNFHTECEQLCSKTDRFSTEA